MLVGILFKYPFEIVVVKLMLIFADGALLQAHDIGIGIQNVLDHRVKIVKFMFFHQSRIHGVV